MLLSEQFNDKQQMYGQLSTEHLHVSLKDTMRVV